MLDPHIIPGIRQAQDTEHSFTKLIARARGARGQDGAAPAIPSPPEGPPHPRSPAAG